jgi:ribosomal protein S21
MQSETTELESQLKWLKRESEEAKVASETHIKEVLTIAEELKAKEAEQASTIEQLKRSARKTQYFSIRLM